MSGTVSISAPGGDADLAVLGAVLAQPARAKILLTLTDGRALPAGVLASEAGIAPSTATSHLGRLVDAGLLTCRQQGRHRYYALAGRQVGELIEMLARLAPPTPVRSLRQGTRAAALRAARTCYDHLAGRLGVDVFAALIARGGIIGGDGFHHAEPAHLDRLSAPGHDITYRLTASGQDRLTDLGVALPAPAPDDTVPLLYCVDWTEQRHHLAGTVGRAFTTRLIDQAWLRRAARGRSVFLTHSGRDQLLTAGIDIPRGD